MGDCNNKTNASNENPSNENPSNENPNVELFMMIIVNIGNILSVLYNVPQMWRTHKLKKADDISSHFLWMRLSAGIIWSIYCIYYQMWYVIISWTTTIISTTQILYYKYYPSQSAPVPLVEFRKMQEGCEEERVDMQLLQKNENVPESRCKNIPIYLN